MCFWAALTGSAAAEIVGGISAQVAGPDTYITLQRSHASAQPKVFQIGGETPRVVMDWDRAKLKPAAFTSGELGHVHNIRHSRQGAHGLRVVLDLAPGSKLLSHEVFRDHLKFHIRGPKIAGAARSAGSRFFDNATPYPRLRPRHAGTRPAATFKRKTVIVIDAGHGGKDPGSIGRSGIYEKSITLKAATELKRQLLAMGKYEVILTRGDDTYIAHEERIRIARAGQGDLFISIHADSTEGNTARGASVYTLADRAKKRIQGIVNSQNWIMDVDLAEQSDPVGDILVDLAQRKTESQSELFADTLLSQLAQSTRLVGNSHRRAGYFVLLAPDVPAVLLELGFLSNAHDEKLLKSAAHRKKVMTSVVTAINHYFAAQKS